MLLVQLASDLHGLTGKNYLHIVCLLLLHETYYVIFFICTLFYYILHEKIIEVATLTLNVYMVQHMCFVR